MKVGWRMGVWLGTAVGMAGWGLGGAKDEDKDEASKALGMDADAYKTLEGWGWAATVTSSVMLAVLVVLGSVTLAMLARLIWKELAALTAAARSLAEGRIRPPPPSSIAMPHALGIRAAPLSRGCTTSLGRPA